MRTVSVTAAGLALAAAMLAAGAAEPPRKTLAAFSSDAEFAGWFKRWEKAVRSAAGPEVRASLSPMASAESVTNVQHAGVDEGGIVKVHGDHLVILRRGRLYTVRIGADALQPVAAIDAYGPGIDPRDAWYDELLIAGDTAVVIGYSYERGGTEIGLFDLSADGRLAYRATYHLRSNDYYSSRNYASRLVGTTLVLYTPLVLAPQTDPFGALPAVRKWRPGADARHFRRIAPATRIYRTDEPLEHGGAIALHSVIRCDLARREPSCDSTAVLGFAGRVFYVSPDAVYVWATPWQYPWLRAHGLGVAASVFRIPLDGSAPQALKVAGSPIDQFSFLQDASGHLNVLVRSDGRGDGMWAAERDGGDLALLRVPLAEFGDGRSAAAAHRYRPLPRPEGDVVNNRFVGDYLLYGSGEHWGWRREVTSSTLYAVRYADGGGAHAVPLPHAVERIEALGAHAVAVGSDGTDLHLTALRLAGRPQPAARYTQRGAAQGETRSHGFFYRADGDDHGVLGLPIVRRDRPGFMQLVQPAAAVLFLRQRALALDALGTLAAGAGGARSDDDCKVSCMDWYGNTRPLFVRGRVFALIGDELVEGRITGGRIAETRRIHYAAARAL